MELLKGPPLPDWDNSTKPQKERNDALRAAALVCSRWRDPAQRALFEELNLVYGIDSKLPNLLASAARARYRTRSLCARSDGEPDAWLKIAESCNGLESLDVHDHIYYQGDLRMSWGALAQPTFAGLKHLGIMFPEKFKDPDDTTTLLGFQLTSLALWLDDGGDDYDDSPGSTSIEGTSPHLIRALCTASLPNLMKLNLRVRNPAPFAPSFALLGPRLRTLILSASRKAFEGQYHLFKTLENLILLDVNLAWDHYGDEEPAGFEFLEGVLDALPSPPTLLHLRIKLHKIPRDESLKSVSENQALGSLVRLELWGFKEETPLDEKQEVGLEAARSVLAELGAAIVLGGL